MTARAHFLTRKYEEEAKEIDLSCIYDEGNELSLDELDKSLDLELDYELDLAEYQQELREFANNPEQVQADPAGKKKDDEEANKSALDSTLISYWEACDHNFS